MAALETPTAERDILGGVPDWDRAVVENKARGLDRPDAVRIATPTGVTVLGLVTHLTYVEGRWFRHHLAGDTTVVSDPGGAYDPDPDLAVEAAIEHYRQACDTSRAIAADLSLDAACAIPHGSMGIVSLRDVLVHMIEETARHLGHLDVLREMTDGQVGDG